MKTKLFQITLTFIGALSVLAISALHAQHLGSYKTPTPEELKSDNIVLAPGQWNIVHFVVKECECSKTLLSHLADRGPILPALETIVLINGDAKNLPHFEDKGFKLQTPSIEDLRRRGLELKGLPLMVIYDPQGQVQYTGGYSNRKISKGTSFEDQEIFKNLQNGFLAKSLPVFGCPVSAETKSILTAFNLGFSKWEGIQ